jgi:hypothetical protein
MPCETEEFRERMDVWHPAYPTTEYGGLVHPQVLARHRATLSNVRHHQYPSPRRWSCCAACACGVTSLSDFVKDCNWLQHYDNLGITDDTIVARLFRDVRPFRIYDLPSEVHRWSIARRATGGWNELSKTAKRNAPQRRRGHREKSLILARRAGAQTRFARNSIS